MTRSSSKTLMQQNELLRENIRRHGLFEASAPCRVDMGGTLDLSTFYLPLRHLNPCTFNMALNMRTKVTLSLFDRGKIKISSKGFKDFVTEGQTAPFDHPMGLMFAVAAFFNASGVHINIDSASPPRSALGGSSVAAVALIWAFAKAFQSQGGKLPTRAQVAALAYAIEQSVAGVPCGRQDHLAAVFGGVNAWYWGTEDDPGGYRRQALDRQSQDTFSRRFLVAYCGEPHVSKDVNRTWVRMFLSGRNRFIWSEIAQLCLQFIHALWRDDMGTAQTMMNRETDLRLKMTPDVLDDMGKALMAEARQNGCGARFTGAGGGGCVWALGDAEHITKLRTCWQTRIRQHETAKLLEASIDMDGVL